MEKLNELLQEMGITKVKLSNFLGISRQMLYNYFEYPSFTDWPQDKKEKIFDLFDIKDINQLKEIVITEELKSHIKNKLTETGSEGYNNLGLDFKGLSKQNGELLLNIFVALKDMLTDDDMHQTNRNTVKYLYNLIQVMENKDALKYYLAYNAKLYGFEKVDKFAFDEEQQTIFEGITYAGFSLYNNGGSSKDRVVQSRKLFIEEIETRIEEKLSQTEEFTSAKGLALKELGYTELNEKNSNEVIAKMVEIMSRSTNA
ncbi:MAG: hypothetical protein ACK5HL_00715 [Bacilli bacterium]